MTHNQLTPRVAHNQLTPRQKQILQEKRLAESLDIRALLDLLAPLARFDAATDRKRSRAGNVGCVSSLLAFAGLFIFAASGGLAPVAALPASGAALAIGALLRYRALKKMDLSNNLRTLAVPLLVVLGEEVDRGAPIDLELDLRRHDVPDKLVREEPPDSGGGYYSIVNRHFKDAWMSGRARLADGARLRWAIVDEIMQQTKRRRNARGKIKTKTKYKKRTTMSVSIALPEAAYTTTGADATASVAGAGERASVRGDVIQLSRVVKARSLDPVDPIAFIDLIAAAYRRAAPAAAAGRQP